MLGGLLFGVRRVVNLAGKVGAAGKKESGLGAHRLADRVRCESCGYQKKECGCAGIATSGYCAIATEECANRGGSRDRCWQRTSMGARGAGRSARRVGESSARRRWSRLRCGTCPAFFSLRRGGVNSVAKERGFPPNKLARRNTTVKGRGGGSRVVSARRGGQLGHSWALGETLWCGDHE